MLNTLYFKLSVALVLLFLVIGTTLVLITRYASDMYYQEMTQRLNASVARYVANEAPLIRDGRVDDLALHALAHQAMILNPTIEVYLVGPDGEVLAHDLGQGVQTRDRIDLHPVDRFLSETRGFPVKGDDPRRGSGAKIFSAAEVRSQERLEGYVYIVLGGEKYERLANSADTSHTLTLSTAAVVACLIFGLGSALLIFSRLSRRLRSLSGKVNRYWFDAASGARSNNASGGDEITQLDQAFDAMRQRIDYQLEQIKQTDRTRRELITNISHDLRTPLTSMQGYIETLLLKDPDIAPAQRREYLTIAHNHGERLGRLVGDLFELARLDSNAVKPQLDTFSLAELVHDIAQEFRLSADNKSIALRVDNAADDCLVHADILLIERVFENLLENALRHTPHGGRITVKLSPAAQGVQVSVADTGPGIAEAALPHIFDRFFQTSPTGDASAKSTGLGLAIVKRILDLHDAAISVSSDQSVGTSFSFSLPISSRRAAYS